MRSILSRAVPRFIETLLEVVPRSRVTGDFNGAATVESCFVAGASAILSEDAQGLPMLRAAAPTGAMEGGIAVDVMTITGRLALDEDSEDVGAATKPRGMPDVVAILFDRERICTELEQHSHGARLASERSRDERRLKSGPREGYAGFVDARTLGDGFADRLYAPGDDGLEERACGLV